MSTCSPSCRFGPVYTGDKAERTFNRQQKSLTIDKVSWVKHVQLWRQCRLRAGDSRLSTKRRQIGDKVESQQLRLPTLLTVCTGPKLNIFISVDYVDSGGIFVARMSNVTSTLSPVCTGQGAISPECLSRGLVSGTSNLAPHLLDGVVCDLWFCGHLSRCKHLNIMLLSHNAKAGALFDGDVLLSVLHLFVHLSVACKAYYCWWWRLITSATWAALTRYYKKKETLAGKKYLVNHLWT